MKNNVPCLEDYVTIEYNNSKIYSKNDIIKVCKRKNNSKRDFLFVNPLLGKHIYIEPKKIFVLYDELVFAIKKSLDLNEKIVVIGFAETATSLGRYIASSLSNCIYYMQTTREKISNTDLLFEFKEEHSHATQQLLYGKIEILEKCDRIIFVDDEISTGNTILNFIKEIEKKCSNLKYGVASLVNFQDKKWHNKFNELDIDIYCILKGQIKNMYAKVPINTYHKDYKCNEIKKLPEIIEVNSKVSNYVSERVGSIPYKLDEFSNTVYDEISNKIYDHLPVKGEKVLVLGTEEYMFTPMIFGKGLYNKLNVEVSFHATTRSPIETSSLDDYAIKQRYSISSCYDTKRDTYLYNLRKYDKVYIVTDVIPNEHFVKTVSGALCTVGCNISDILIIFMKG